jgi:hypothetical protein
LQIARGQRRVCCDSVRANGARGRWSRAARFAVIWFTAFSLIFQTVFAMAAPMQRVQPDALALAEICNAIGSHQPADQPGQLAGGHFQCIACVIAHSLAPPPLAAVSAPLRLAFDRPQRWPLSASQQIAAPRSQHSARGPPAT